MCVCVRVGWRTSFLFKKFIISKKKKENKANVIIEIFTNMKNMFGEILNELYKYRKVSWQKFPMHDTQRKDVRVCVLGELDKNKYLWFNLWLVPLKRVILVERNFLISQKMKP